MDNRVLYGILTILTPYGITYFMQGKIKNGILKIVFSVLCFVIGIINAVMGIVLAIKIFKMTDEEFAAADKSALLTGIINVKE